MRPRANAAIDIPTSVAPPTSASASPKSWSTMRRRVAPSDVRTRDLSLARHGAGEHERRHVRADDDHQEDEQEPGAREEQGDQTVRRAAGELDDPGRELPVDPGEVGRGAAAGVVQLGLGGPPVGRLDAKAIM
jgi:hypothetical protein